LRNFKLLINPTLTYGIPKASLKTNTDDFNDDEVYRHITLSFISATQDVYLYLGNLSATHYFVGSLTMLLN